jgi:dihydrofolate reductase
MSQRRLIVTQNATADSVIEMLGDWFDPAGGATDETIAEMRAVEERLRASADALLVGRKTFESFRGYWPHQVDDQTGVRDYLDRVDKYVISSTMTIPGWANSTILRGPLIDEVAALKSRPGGDIVATRKHHDGPCPQRERPGRRIPALRLPSSRRPRSSTLRSRATATESRTHRSASVQFRCRAPPIPSLLICTKSTPPAATHKNGGTVARARPHLAAHVSDHSRQ